MATKKKTKPIKPVKTNVIGGQMQRGVSGTNAIADKEVRRGVK